MFNEYPYRNIEDLNLDYLQARVRNLEKIVEQFVALESVTFHNPIQWNITTQYAKNVVVLDEGGDAFISIKPVPAGVYLNNGEYWLEVFNFMDYVKSFDANLTFNIESNTERASIAYSVGDWLLLDDVLYKVLVAIPADGLFEIGVNIEHFTVEDFIKAWINYANGLIVQYKNDIDASELLYRNQLAGDIASTTASLQAQLDAAIAGATVDSEVINARIGADGVTYSTLGDAIRAQIKNADDISHSVHNLRGNINLLNNAAYYYAGKYIDYSDGKMGNNATFGTYWFIPVEASETLWLTLWENSLSVAFYDSYGVYVSGFTRTIASDTIVSEIIVPSGCHYMSLSYATVTAISKGENIRLIPVDYFYNLDTKYQSDYGYKRFKNTAKICNRNLIDNDMGRFGEFYNYSTGTLASNSQFTAIQIPAIANAVYRCNSGYNHVSFMDANNDYISGVTGASALQFTTPANCVAINLGIRRLDANNNLINPYLICDSVNEPIYTPFGSGDLYAINTVNILTVGVDQQFQTITEAFNAASDGDTILIFPGTYVESIHAYNKKVHFKGTCKQQCILKYSADNYYYPPLEIAKGSVENMTIYANWSGNTDNLRAFCVHIDDNNERNEDLSFYNVDFISERGYTVGIGLRTGCHLKFENCTFNNTNTASIEGTIYNHTSELDDQGYSNQNVEYKDCIIINQSTYYTIHLQSQEREDKCCDITFINNKIIEPNNNNHSITMTLYQGRTLTNTNYLGSSDFVLTNVSEYNSAADMNYSEQ